jgi:uncharacterized protein YdhG (YjbR/CyaY superfamily)
MNIKTNFVLTDSSKEYIKIICQNIKELKEETEKLLSQIKEETAPEPSKDVIHNFNKHTG